MTKWVAALPMYNVTPELGECWNSLLRDVLRGLATGNARTAIEPLHEPLGDLRSLWTRDDLFLSQTCGYPLARTLPDAIQVVSTPVFDAPGCEGPRYSSCIVVSERAYARNATTLEACRGLHAAFNGLDSNSGMNVFRHAVAPYAREGRFFGNVTQTGSHLGSLRLVAEGAADVTAIDCVTLAFAGDAWPELLERVKIIGSTVSSPGLPLIASGAVDAVRIDALRDALDAAVLADPLRARRLRLRGFARLTRRDYGEIVQIENDAFARGYATLQ